MIFAVSSTEEYNRPLFRIVYQHSLDELVIVTPLLHSCIVISCHTITIDISTTSSQHVNNESSILQCQTSLHKREQVVIDCSVLCALQNFMKNAFLIAVYLVGIFYHIQWLMLAPFHVYLTLNCHPLHVVLNFNNL